MRANLSFTRNKGAGAAVPVLGTADPDPRVTAPNDGKDNVITLRCAAAWGGSLKRVGIGYTPPSGTAALLFEVYVYDEKTAKWFIVQTSTSLPAGAISYTSLVPVPTDNPEKDADGNIVKGDNVRVLVRIIDIVGPDGAHVFTVYADYQG